MPHGQGCRSRLKFGAISSIARMTGINIHTVRLWVTHGEPDKSKLPARKQAELRKAIIAHIKAGNKN